MKNSNQIVKRSSFPTVELNEQVILIRELLRNYPEGCFIQVKHKHPQSQFNFENAPECFLISFDEQEKKKIKTLRCSAITPFKPNWQGTFHHLSPEKLQLILPQTEFKKFKWEKSFQLK